MNKIALFSLKAFLYLSLKYFPVSNIQKNIQNL
jgi:hypothetical protein